MPACELNKKFQAIALERKEAKFEKEQAEQYERLLNEQAEAKTQYTLFQLYIHDKDQKSCQKTIKGLKKQVDKLLKKRTECDLELKKEKAEIGKIQREVSSVEKKCEEKQTKITELRPNVIKARDLYYEFHKYGVIAHKFEKIMYFFAN